MFSQQLWLNFLLQAAICLPLVWALGALFFLLLEKPFMRISLPVWVPFRRLKFRLGSRSGVFLLLFILPFSLQAQALSPAAELPDSALGHTATTATQRTDIQRFAQRA